MKQEIENRINQTLGFLSKNFWPLFVIGVPLLLILEVLVIGINNMDPDNENPIFALIKMISYFFINGLIVLLFIYLINNIHTNTVFSLNDLINFVMKSILNVSIALWAIKLLTGLGLILLIIPGIYLLVRTALALFLISLDKVNLKDAFRLAFENSEKQSWVMVFSIIILAIPSVIFFGMRYFAETQISLSVLNIILELTYVIEYVLIYFFYLDIRSNMAVQLNRNL